MGHPEWLEDSRFARLEDRTANAPELIALLDEIFATKTRDEWAAIFDAEKDMWWAPVQALDEVIADPQVAAGGGFVDVPDVPDGKTTTTFPATPVDFHGTPWQARWMAPEHGQHTDEVLTDLGCDSERIAGLREKGVVA